MRFTTVDIALDVDRAGDYSVRTDQGDTTYLCTAEAGGMAVSLIQSNASGFGSWLAEPNTGINLHNRGLGFNLRAGHPAELGPGRRPPHTLSPALATRDRDARCRVRHDGWRRPAPDPAAGGGPSVPSSALPRIGDRRPEVGACRAPRPVSTSGTRPRVQPVELERHAPADGSTVSSPAGTQITSLPADRGIGHVQAIVVGDDGVLAGAADPRARVGAVIGRVTAERPLVMRRAASPPG